MRYAFVFSDSRPGTTRTMADDPEARLLALFERKAELLPLWLQLRPAVERLGPDVRVRPRMVYAEFDRGDGEFLIAEPTSHRRLELGLHNPGLPVTPRFRPADEFGSRRITHRVSWPEPDELDPELLARIGEAYDLVLAGAAR
jgi:uncharacterized protein DUF5655